MRKIFLSSFFILLFINVLNSNAVRYAIVDTGQDRFYDDKKEIRRPGRGDDFYGEDAEYYINHPSYRDNGNGTVTDLNTWLTWTKAVDNDKVSFEASETAAKNIRVGGSSDWRVPNIKELYSLIKFNSAPFIDTIYFDFKYGQTNKGERYIDAQWLSSTKYVSTTMDGAETVFGVNFADGRIKGYGFKDPHGMRPEKKFYIRYVRGPVDYGKNDFEDNGDGTVTDRATGLMWMKKDSEIGMNWEDALKYAETTQFAGYGDWRLPNAKELHSIVDYTRSPDTTSSPAIDPIFNTTSIINERGEKDYPYFWTSTTHAEGPRGGEDAVYIAFGRALGIMHDTIMDVHGAGSQRSDPKIGEPGSRGPQGDIIRVNNFVRCVRELKE